MTEPPQMQPLLLSELLGKDLDATQYKLHCACRNEKGEDPLEIYARGDWESWVWWNKYRPVKNDSRLKFENCLSFIEVVEVARLPWAGQPFPGIDSINHTFRQLEVIVETGRADWRNVLDNLKGVYLWNDRATGRAYIGSATSATGGLWSRLTNYVASGHGGNKLLLDLVGDNGPDYIRENFSYALLE